MRIPFDIRKAYFAAAIVVAVFLAIIPDTELGREYNAFLIAAKAGIPNTVTAIYLENRLYDTMFEVMVFSISITGALYFLKKENKFQLHDSLFTDPATIIIFRGCAMLSFLSACALAAVGHLSPGGGFAAGVAFGTSMVIQSLISDRNHLSNYLSMERPEKLEKSSWIFILAISLLTFSEIIPPDGVWGNLLSGGWIPMLNILIAIKVGLGTWALCLGFLDHKWIF